MTKAKPYDFKPPKDSPLLISIAKLLLPLLIKFKYGDMQLKILDNGLDKLRSLKNIRTIICPNHPSPADIEVVSLFSKEIGEQLNFLVARELFHARPGRATLLEYLGCYSVSRGASDFASYRTTRDLIVQGKKKLLIFPEGEVSHQADHLLPLKAGAIHMAFAALHKLRSMQNIAPVMLLPLALKYTYKQNIKIMLEKTISRLEHSLNIKTSEELTLLNRVHNLCDKFISQYEYEYNCSAQSSSSLNERIQNIRQTILSQAVAQLHCDLPQNCTLLDQIHFLQSLIYDLRWRKKQYANFFSKLDINKLARNLHRSVNSMGILEESFVQPVTQEKIASLIEVLEQDIYHHISPKGPLLIYCHIGDPINLAEYYADFVSNKEETIMQVTRLLADKLSQQVQTLDCIAPHIYV